MGVSSERVAVSIHIHHSFHEIYKHFFLHSRNEQCTIHWFDYLFYLIYYISVRQHERKSFFFPAPQYHLVLPPAWWRHHRPIRNPTNQTWRTILPLILHFTHNSSWIISSHTSASQLLPKHWCLLITCTYRMRQGTKGWLSSDVNRENNVSDFLILINCIFLFFMSGLCQCAKYYILNASKIKATM